MRGNLVFAAHWCRSGPPALGVRFGEELMRQGPRIPRQDGVCRTPDTYAPIQSVVFDGEEGAFLSAAPRALQREHGPGDGHAHSVGRVPSQTDTHVSGAGN